MLRAWEEQLGYGHESSRPGAAELEPIAGSRSGKTDWLFSSLRVYVYFRGARLVEGCRGAERLQRWVLWA